MYSQNQGDASLSAILFKIPVKKDNGNPQAD
jgi:hypothetical protein